MSPQFDRYYKDPQAKLDYMVDWTGQLVSGETISTSTWAIDAPPDAVLTIATSPAPSNTTTTATVWVEGGTEGKTYLVRNRIITSQGRTDDRTLAIYISQQ